MASICVFCSSSDRAQKVFQSAAREVGMLLARGGHTVVYGGAQLGLMGQLADGALEAGGTVVGIMPKWLAREEVVHAGLSELIEVDTMLERKERMFALSDGYATLPGGIGTLDELFEILTMEYLGRISAPMALLNTADFYAPLLTMIDQGIAREMVAPSVREKLRVTRTPADLVQAVVQEV